MRDTYIHPLQIGDVILENNLLLAPMAGVTDLPFRLLCRKMGAGMVCMEMVSAKAILYNNRNTNALMEIHPEELPTSLQLFGSDPDIISEMAARIEERPFAVLDINMGCPVPKVVNNHEGSALMKNPKLAAEIIRKTVGKIKKPVTAKIRIGFDEEHINGVEMAKYLEDAGACAIAVHGRTRSQMYAGNANWEEIRKIKEALHIPVIGNGDVVDGNSAKKLFEETGVDGIMIGRAVRGNPWIFREVLSELSTGEKPGRPTYTQMREMILSHAALMLQTKGEYIGIREMRKHVSWYTAGIPGSAQLRGKINSVETFEELEELVKRIFSQN